MCDGGMTRRRARMLYLAIFPPSLSRPHKAQTKPSTPRPVPRSYSNVMLESVRVRAAVSCPHAPPLATTLPMCHDSPTSPQATNHKPQTTAVHLHSMGNHHKQVSIPQRTPNTQLRAITDVAPLQRRHRRPASSRPMRQPLRRQQRVCELLLSPRAQLCCSCGATPRRRRLLMPPTYY